VGENRLECGRNNPQFQELLGARLLETQYEWINDLSNAMSTANLHRHVVFSSPSSYIKAGDLVLKMSLRADKPMKTFKKMAKELWHDVGWDSVMSEVPGFGHLRDPRLNFELSLWTFCTHARGNMQPSIVNLSQGADYKCWYRWPSMFDGDPL